MAWPARPRRERNSFPVEAAFVSLGMLFRSTYLGSFVIDQGVECSETLDLTGGERKVSFRPPGIPLSRSFWGLDPF